MIDYEKVLLPKLNTTTTTIKTVVGLLLNNNKINLKQHFITIKGNNKTKCSIQICMDFIMCIKSGQIQCTTSKYFANIYIYKNKK